MSIKSRPSSAFLSIGVLTGQAVHAAPIVICSLGVFLAQPSLWSFALIVVAGFASAVATGFALLIDGFKQVLRTYYDFCCRFKGCKLTEYKIVDYVGFQVWKQANHTKILPNVVDAPIEEIKLSTFCVSRNQNPDRATPPQLCSYIATKPFRTYIFFRNTPDQMQSAMRKFQMYHELGHISLGTQYMLSPLALGLLSYYWLSIWIWINVDYFTMSNLGIIFGVYVLLAITGKRLVRQLRNDRWLFEESQADYFALENMSSEERQEINEKLMRKNYLKDDKVDPVYSEIRLKLLQDAINGFESQHPVGVRFSKNLVSRYIVFSITGLALIFLGFVSKEVKFIDVLENALLLIIFPLFLYIVLLVIALKTNIAVANCVEDMKDVSKNICLQWMDSLLPIFRLLLKL